MSKNFSLIADSGIQFYTSKINLNPKSKALKTNLDFFEKLEEDIEGNKEYTLITTKNNKDISNLQMKFVKLLRIPIPEKLKKVKSLSI